MTEDVYPTATFRIIPLSARDIAGQDTAGEPALTYSEALEAARQLKSEGRAFRFIADGPCTEEQRDKFRELGAVE